MDGEAAAQRGNLSTLVELLRSSARLIRNGALADRGATGLVLRRKGEQIVWESHGLDPVKWSRKLSPAERAAFINETGIDLGDQPLPIGPPETDDELHGHLSRASLFGMKLRSPEYGCPPSAEELETCADTLARFDQSAPAPESSARLEAAAEVNSHTIDRAAAKAVEAMEIRDDTGIGGTDTDWKVVQGQLLAKRERREPYTSLRKLSAELGCSDGVIRKAIKASETLKGWRARSKEPKSAPKATDLGAVVSDNTRQTTEPSPVDSVADGPVDTIMAYLLRQSPACDRSELKAMSAPERRTRAVEYSDAKMAKLIEEAKPTERAELNAMDEPDRLRLVATLCDQNLDDEPSPLKPDKPGERLRNVKQHKRA